MSKKNVEEEKIDVDVFFDVENVVDILSTRGIRKDMTSIAKEMGYSMVGLRTLRSKAPKSVCVLHNFLKNNFLKYEDLVKEVKSKN